MGILDIVKEIVGSFNLVKIKNVVNNYGDINIPFKGDTIHHSVPKEDQVKIKNAKITPDMEKLLEQKLMEYVKIKRPFLEKLSEKQISMDIAGTSVATSVSILSDVAEIPTGPLFQGGNDFLEGECDTNISFGTPPIKKSPFGSDEGETI